MTDFVSHDLSKTRESISLTTSKSLPFYTLGFPGNYEESTVGCSMVVTRGHPLNVNLEMMVTSIQLLSPISSLAGRVAEIFPRNAEVKALDQSSSIAIEHGLPRSASKDLEKEAVVRARERETSVLLHDAETDKYTLVHPTLAHGDPAAFPIEMFPLERPSTIHITSPYESDKSLLVAINLATKRLEISSGLIAELPSVYAVDTLVSASLCLLLHLQRSKSFLEPYFLDLPPRPAASIAFEPPPSSAFNDSSTRKQREQQNSTTWLSIRAKHTPDVEVMEKVWTDSQLDLSRFYPFAAEDQRLSQGTRLCLKLLYLCFEALVWITGSFVGIVAAGIVKIGSRVTT